MESQLNTIDKINLRLEALKKYVNQLEKYKGIEVSRLKKDDDLQAIVERRLQLAIEACIDIAELIIVDQSLPTPGSNREAIEILGEEGVINKEFAQRFAKAAGFRNILIHDYLELDYEKIAVYLKENLSDFHRYIKEILDYFK